MRTVSLVLDIQTQSLDSLYTYVVPADMVGVEVGCAVLVEFGARRAIGYVMEVCERPDSEIDPTSVSRLKPLLSVLSSPYFDEDGALAENEDVDYYGTTLHAGRDGIIEGITYD